MILEDVFRMYYAPIIIPTLCRYEHFKKCIESLDSNPWAKHTDVYVGLDYPSKDSYKEGYAKICEYLDTADLSFANVHVIKREENYGAVRNVEDLFDIVSREYDRYILTEDDNIFSVNFLEYMDTMLEYIKDKKEYFGVCGYSYPVYWVTDALHTNIELQTAFPAWGYATFFSNRNRMIEEYTHDFLVKSIRCEDKVKKIRSLGNIPFNWYINRVWDTEVLHHDIDMQIYQVITDKASILPCKSLVRNMGWDGTGLNCQTTAFDFSTQNIDNEPISFDIMPPSDTNEKNTWEFICSLNSISYVTVLKTWIKFVLLRLGLKR
ncbi:MAG: glycosyltransferase [Butyrivibrio sp.]|nr:glycosyltransferase [Butyrivibrio sp.]